MTTTTEALNVAELRRLLVEAGPIDWFWLRRPISPAECAISLLYESRDALLDAAEERDRLRAELDDEFRIVSQSQGDEILRLKADNERLQQAHTNNVSIALGVAAGNDLLKADNMRLREKLESVPYIIESRVNASGQMTTINGQHSVSWIAEYCKWQRSIPAALDATPPTKR